MKIYFINKNFIKFIAFLIFTLAVIEISIAKISFEDKQSSQWTKINAISPIIKKSQDYFRDGLYDESLSLLNGFLGAQHNISDRTKVLIYIGLASNYIEKGITCQNNDETKKCYNKAYLYFNNALEIINNKDPLNISMYSGLGFIYFQLKDYNKAITYLKESFKYPLTKFNKEYIDICTNLGYAYSDLKQYEEAVKYFNQALKLYPTDYQRNIIYSGLANCYKQVKNYNQATKYFKRILMVVPQNSKEYITASEDYIYVFLKYKFKKFSSLSWLLLLLREIDKYSQKNEEILLNDYVWRILDRCNDLLQYKTEKEINLILSKYNLFKNNPIFNHLFWGNYYNYKDDTANAKEDFLNILKINAKSPVAYTGLKNSYIKNGSPLEALKCFMIAKENIGGKIYFPVYRGLYKIYYLFQKKVPLENLELLFETLRQILPQYQDILYCARGEIYFKNNILDKAEESFYLAIRYQLSPNVAHPEWPYIGLGLICLRKNNYDSAEDYFRKAIEIDPCSLRAMKELGDLYFNTGQFNKAKELYQKTIIQALEIDNEEAIEGLIPYIYLQLGDIYLKENKKRVAKKYYNIVLQYEDLNNKNKALERLTEMN